MKTAVLKTLCLMVLLLRGSAALLFCGSAAWVLCSSAAWADEKGDCGTIVVPTGIGTVSGADINSVNPLLSNSTYDAEAGELMYMDLIWINRFDAIDYSRSLASAISSPDNGTTYDVTLRPWHWSDGVQVTTADVAYTFQLIKQLGTTYPGYGAGGMPEIIKSLNIISPTQFQVVLKRQVNPLWFIYNGLGQLSPLPRHSWGKYTLDQIWQNQSTPAFFNVVDGPLKTQALDIGLDLIMVPNPRYEGPKMHFQRLVFKFIESDGGTLQQVESGEVDMANISLVVWNAVQHLPGISIVRLPPALSWNFIALNFRNPKVAFWRDARVREAMQDAINQPAMVKYLFHGLGVEEYGPVPPVPPTFLSPEMKAGVYPVGHDLARARALLAAAGYAPGPDGIMQRDGKKLSFIYLMLTGDALIEQMTLEIQAELRQAGIQMIVHEIEFNQMLAKLNGGGADWEAAELQETVDDLVAASTDKPGLAGLYDYEAYTSAQQPVIFHATQSTAVLVRSRIHGMADFIDPASQFSPEQLYCTPGTER
jgi:peptide/nickel transport system substrate-binding protein